MGDGSTYCDVGAGSFPKCFYGPCGAGIVNSPEGTPGGYNAHVFMPNSKPQSCGYDVSIKHGDVLVSEHDPETYSGQQNYPGVTASCPYTSCRVGGKRADLISIEIAGEATGLVRIDSLGIALSGAARARLAFSESITLIAEPAGEHARALFSGDCIKTGDYGKKAECGVKLAPNPKVTVTYECPKGFTCEPSRKN